MNYSEFVEVYENIGKTTKRLEKVALLSEFLKKIDKLQDYDLIYLLKGRILPDYDSRELGISNQIVIKAISVSFGVKISEIIESFNKLGDLGDVAEKISKRKKQSTLFSKKLTVECVFKNLKKIILIEGKGAIDKKISLISELLGFASEKEVKYIVRTLIGDLRLGVADALIIDSIYKAYFQEDKKIRDSLENAYDLSNDFSEIFRVVSKEGDIGKIHLIPGKPINVMLPVKVLDIKEAFRICGKPAAIEHKYDGFRVVIHKFNNQIYLFTRKLENVTKQFPDVVEVIKKNIQAKSFIFDSEIVGYDPVTGKYKPFEAISQRIKRKYDIEKLVNKLPVEINIFDILYYDGASVMDKPFRDRRKLILKIVKTDNKKIRPAFQIVTDNEKEAFEFYEDALKIGEEGIIVKNINAEYRSGRRIGYMVKMKPNANDLDLVIVRAEYGTGKRAGWLTSYTVACQSDDGFLEVGKVSSGLKEIEGEGTTYDEMTFLLKPLIEDEIGNEVKVKPKIIVSVTYQNIQRSPSYSSGFALRFPRITSYRPDKNLDEIASINEIEKEI